MFLIISGNNMPTAPKISKIEIDFIIHGSKYFTHLISIDNTLCGFISIEKPYIKKEEIKTILIKIIAVFIICLSIYYI